MMRSYSQSVFATTLKFINFVDSIATFAEPALAQVDESNLQGYFGKTE
jgi:hypothetical protein